MTAVPASSVTVNGQIAQRYGDFTFAAANLSLISGPNAFTNVAQSTLGLSVTNILNINLPANVNLQFDLNGNLTNDGTRSFAYDAQNELVTTWVPGAWQSVFVYDGLGRRRVVLDNAWQSGQWVTTNVTRYLYDGWLPIQERDGNNAVKVTYTRGLDLSGTLQYGGLPRQSGATAGGIGGLLARTDSNGSTFYHTDGAGNVTGLMNGQQDMAARYLYGAFGKLTAQWGPLAGANAMQFSSMAHHANSGLSLYPLRAYDPSFQRWVTRDPIGEMGGINLYQSVGNNPLAYVDPSGANWLGDQMRLVGQGLYDLMMGDRPGKYDPNSLGALDAQMGVMDIDRNDNVLRDSMGAALGAVGAIGQEIATAYAGGKAAEAALGVAGAAACKVKPLLQGLGDALPSAAKAAAEGANLAGEGAAPQLEFPFVKDVGGSDVTYLYQKVGAAGEHLKFGVTDNPATRYSAAELNGGSLRIIGQGERSEMLGLERQLHETLPIGPEEGQLFYIQKQVQNGLKPPPY